MCIFSTPFSEIEKRKRLHKLTSCHVARWQDNLLEEEEEE